MLKPLPIEALRLAQQTVELLHQLGVYRVEELARIPRQDWNCRFGPEIMRRWDQALGNLPEPIPALPLAPNLEVNHFLEYPIAEQHAIESVLEQLIRRLVQRLLDCGRGILRLDCKLHCTSASVVEFSVGLFEPSASTEHLLELVHMQLERLVLSGPVSGVCVRAGLTACLQQRQEELFADAPGHHCRQYLPELIDRLSSRLGFHSVVQAKLLPEAQPELAYCYEPLVARVARKFPKRSAGLSPRPGPLRPSRLLRQPIGLAVISIAPDGPPVRFRFGGHLHRVAHSWGPERIETGWWRGRTVKRDYYRVQTTDGRCYWLFRRLEDGKWFLHGLFE